MKKLQGTELSKFLSLILRHKPETIQLDLNEYGYASIKDIISNSFSDNIEITRGDLLNVVLASGKKRFVLSENGQHIKAVKGHSLPIKLEISPTEPPKNLYHGTIKKLSDKIQKEGIKRMKRSHVHLNSEFSSSYITGSRRQKEPTVFVIDAKRMFKDNFTFYKTENNLWLTEFVPPKYIKQKDIRSAFDLEEIEIVVSTTFQKLNAIKLDKRNYQRRILRITNLNCFICKAKESQLDFDSKRVICFETGYKKNKIQHYFPGEFISTNIQETSDRITVFRTGKIQYETKSIENLVNSVKNTDLDFAGTGLWYNCSKCEALNLISNSSKENEVYKCSTCKEELVKQIGQTKIEIKN